MASFSTVLVPLDGSSFGESVLPHVRVLARVADADVHLVSVIDAGPDGGPLPGGAEMRLQAVEAERYLEGVADRLRESGLETGTEVRAGRPAEEIVRAAVETGADLVALAARPRREEAHLVSRGVALTVAASGVASVLVARGDGGRRLPALWREARYRTVMAPVDGSAPSRRALELAAAVAEGEGAELLAVRIEPGEGPGPSRREDRCVDTPAEGEAPAWTACLERAAGGEPADDAAARRAVRCPGVPEAVDEVARGIAPDLLVFAAHGGGEAAGTYGHCARWLLLHADAPVLVLQDRPAGPSGASLGRPGGVRRRRRQGRPGSLRRARPEVNARRP